MLVLGLPLPWLAAGVGGYVLARRALAPIERMTTHARTITAERLNDRLPVDNPDDEMGRLAGVFNQTLGRLEQSFEQMRRFTADVSHQLRTPLTAIRSVGEVGLRAGRRDEAGYRAIIGSMLEETDRLAVLVDRLLTLSRAEMHQATLAPDSVNLVELAEDVVGHLGVLAEEKGQSLSIEAEGAPTAVVDRVVLRQALINLVDNAIKFTPTGRAGVVSGCPAATALRSSTCQIRVPVFRQTSQERIFDRFYRGDEEAGIGDRSGTVDRERRCRGEWRGSEGRVLRARRDNVPNHPAATRGVGLIAPLIRLVTRETVSELEPKGDRNGAQLQFFSMRPLAVALVVFGWWSARYRPRRTPEKSAASCATHRAAFCRAPRSSPNTSTVVPESNAWPTSRAGTSCQRSVSDLPHHGAARWLSAPGA